MSTSAAVAPGSRLVLSAHKPLKDNLTKFSTFISEFVAFHSPTKPLKQTELPEETVRKQPFVTYLALNQINNNNSGGDNQKTRFIEKDQFLKQATAIYEEGVRLNPFLNTVVAPTIIGLPSTKEEQQLNNNKFPREISKTGLSIQTSIDGVDDNDGDLINSSSTNFSVITADDLQKQAELYPLHDYVALGGTFDRLHPGHKMLLTQAALATAKKLRVGITGPKLLVNKKNAEMLQSFEVRCQAAQDFLRVLRPDLILEVVELEEKSGGTNEIAEVDAMVVSPETFPALESINKERREKGFKDMKPVLIDFLGGDSNETRISSSKLRQMEMSATSNSDTEQGKKFE